MTRKIFSGEYEGFVVFRNLEISKNAQTDHMGFCVQRTDQIPQESTTGKLLDETKNRGIIGAHRFKGIHVAHTLYLKFFYNGFGFERPIVILHAVFYRHMHYLKPEVEKFLILRREMKLAGDAVSLAKANFYKLILNGIYGYCLCRFNSNTSPYSVESLITRRWWREKVQKRKAEKAIILGVEEVGTTHVAVLTRSYELGKGGGAPLGTVGATILGHSKVILLESLGFLLRFLDPRLAEFVYSDTDSIFVAMHYEKIIDNVCVDLREEFENTVGNYIDSPTQLSGYLVNEKCTKGIFIYGEKMYSFVTGDGKVGGTRMKGVQHRYLKEVTWSRAERMVKDGAEMTCVSNSLKRVKDGYIGLETEVKRFKAALNPRKRFFTGNHSLAWE